MHNIIIHTIGIHYILPLSTSNFLLNMSVNDSIHHIQKLSSRVLNHCFIYHMLSVLYWIA